MARWMLGLMGWIVACSAQAALVHIETENSLPDDTFCQRVGCFDTEAFYAAVAAAGVTDLRLNGLTGNRFNEWGVGLPWSGPVNGNVYSADFTFSSGRSNVFGGSDSKLVHHDCADLPNCNYVSPVDRIGLLFIDFIRPIGATGIVMSLSGDESILVYGLQDELLGSFEGSLLGIQHQGFVATGDDLIKRIVLDGFRFGVRSIEYGCSSADSNTPACFANPVSEPGTLALLGAALVGVLTIRRRQT